MSNQNWLPDSAEQQSSGQTTTPYVVVPRLALAGGIGLNRLNIAGWAAKEDSPYACKACKKQVRLSLVELRLFPLIKPEVDLFQFVFQVPPHRSGGALSLEMCPASGTREVRNHEFPTSVRSLEKEKVLTGATEEVSSESGQPPPAPTEERRVTEKEVRAKVAAFSPQMAEERYNYLLGKQITELTDEEYSERLALVERLTEKEKKEKK